MAFVRALLALMALTARLQSASTLTILVAARMIAQESDIARRITLAFAHQDMMTFLIALKSGCATTAAVDTVFAATDYVSVLQDMRDQTVQPRSLLRPPHAHTAA